MTHIGSAFLPVSDPEAAARWYSGTFGWPVLSIEDHAAVLQTSGSAKLTLMGPRSGISAQPGLAWAPFNLIATDLDELCGRLNEIGGDVGEVNGDDETCFWFTTKDPDGNTLLIADR